MEAQDRKKIPKSATSTSTFTANSTRLRDTGACGALAWHSGTMAFPLAGAATIFLPESPSAHASNFLRSQGAHGSEPTIKMGTRLT